MEKTIVVFARMKNVIASADDVCDAILSLEHFECHRHEPYVLGALPMSINILALATLLERASS